MKNDTIICNCMQITLEELREALKKGVATLESLQDEIGVATGCGRCAPQVTRIADKHEVK